LEMRREHVWFIYVSELPWQYVFGYYAMEKGLR
jgi:hypothetical protein